MLYVLLVLITVAVKCGGDSAVATTLYHAEMDLAVKMHCRSQPGELWGVFCWSTRPPALCH